MIKIPPRRLKLNLEGKEKRLGQPELRGVENATQCHGGCLRGQFAMEGPLCA